MGGHVGYERRGSLGLIELKRPEALNALSLEMIRGIAAAIGEAEADDSVTAIAIHAQEGRAFSAGGDIRALYDWGRGGRRELFQFYREEYRLNAQIARCPKPYVALVHGIVMGGGAGISMHGSHFFAAEETTFAMPEVGIGFVPDVGSSLFLNRMPGQSGLYVALTGERINAADLVWSGLGRAVVPRHRFGDLIEALARGEDATEAARRFRISEGQGRLAGLLDAIDRIFARDPVESILEALQAEEGERAEWAAATAAIIRRQCPTSVKAAFALLKAGRGASLEVCLLNEFRVVSRIVQRADFYEGVRAAVIDKDRSPRWRPDSLDRVSDEDITGLLAPSPMGDLVVD